MIKWFRKISARDKKIILIFFLITGLMGGLSSTGWQGYYEMSSPAFYEKKFDPTHYGYSYGSIFFSSSEEIHLELPANCSGFSLMGIITPLTPPIPTFWFRGWRWFDSLCNGNFTIQSKPIATLKLKLEDQKTHEVKLYNPQVSQALYGYTRHTFPIKSKNLDSGILIIEKNGEIIEVPFEYKYQKFWH